MDLTLAPVAILVPQMLIYITTGEAAPVLKTSLSMFSTPHLSVPVPQSGVKLVSSDSRHSASLKKGGPERGRFFCFSRSCTLAIRDEIRKNRLFPHPPHSPLSGCLP